MKSEYGHYTELLQGVCSDEYIGDDTEVIGFYILREMTPHGVVVSLIRNDDDKHLNVYQFYSLDWFEGREWYWPDDRSQERMYVSEILNDQK